jgi:hypothetical protein
MLSNMCSAVSESPSIIHLELPRSFSVFGRVQGGVSETLIEVMASHLKSILGRITEVNQVLNDRIVNCTNAQRDSTQG